jgi:peptidoglycan hydrolase CwlO-like protein
MEDSILTVLGTVISMVIMGGVTLFIARKTGLSDIQKAAGAAQDATMKAQRERIELLEEKVNDLTAKVEELEIERKRDKALIERLRKAIADKAIEGISGTE